MDSILGVCDAKHVMDQLQEVRDTWISFRPGVALGEANYFFLEVAFGVTWVRLQTAFFLKQQLKFL